MAVSQTFTRPAVRSEVNLGLPAVGRMVAGETAKHLSVLWRRRATFAIELAVMAVFYLVVQWVIGGGRFVDELLPATMLGFYFYVVAYLLLVKVVTGLLEEMNTGTLEQIHLSPLPPWLLSVGLLVAVLIEGVLVATALSAVLVVALDVDFAGLTWDALVPAALTFLNVAGFAMLVGGVALTVASIGAINHVLYGIIGMLNGAYVPVFAYPEWLQVVAKLLPSTLGIDAMRRILIDDATLASIWSDGSLPWLLVHTAVMLLAGWTVYQWQVRRGLRDGRLGPK
ncbi:MAG: hypothetical protein GEU80_11955 [Dehalococcoidia bacterium]|nr:hypothetical protein [Dehalococcoidia bacterium]